MRRIPEQNDPAAVIMLAEAHGQGKGGAGAQGLYWPEPAAAGLLEGGGEALVVLRQQRPGLRPRPGPDDG